MELKVEAAARTDTGLVRRNNQDCFGADAERGLYVVCDGMGGAAGGEIASQLAVETFLAVTRQELYTTFPERPQAGSQTNGHINSQPNGQLTSQALRRAVAAANRAVVSRAEWDTCYRGMGSTLVGALLEHDKLTLINVGDSRAYLFRNGLISQLTQDHSFVAERVRLGIMDPAEAETSPMQSVITRAIGVEADVRPDLYELTLEPGDTLLLTSDGLTRHVRPAEIQASLVITAEQAGEAAQACTRLIELANQHGGSDNITCIVIRAYASHPA